MIKLCNVRLHFPLVARAVRLSEEKVLMITVFSLTLLVCINQFHALLFYQLIILIPVLSDTPNFNLLNLGVNIIDKAKAYRCF